MGLLEMALDAIADLFDMIASFVADLNPCPFKDGISFGSGFDTAFGILNEYVDVAFCVAAVEAWAVALGMAWVVMLVWRWIKAQ